MTMPEFALGEYETEETDAMLDELVEADGEEFTERRRGRSRGRTPSRRPGVAEAQRNGQGIKAINDRINALDSKVDQAVKAIAHERAAVRRLEKLGKIDGALDLAASLTSDPSTGAISIDVFQVVKGSLKSGFLGEPKGALGNPALIGAAGLLLRNPGILGRVLNPTP
jgi:hypothetical protein